MEWTQGRPASAFLSARVGLVWFGWSPVTVVLLYVLTSNASKQTDLDEELPPAAIAIACRSSVYEFMK